MRSEIQTPCLVLDLDALERNIVKMGNFAQQMGVRHRVHGKMHKSVDVALLQERLGNSVGVCCQKVSEAEVFARVASGMFLSQIKFGIQRRLTGLRAFQSWVRGLSVR